MTGLKVQTAISVSRIMVV